MGALSLKPPQAVVETSLTQKELMAILEVLPKGEKEKKTGKELKGLLAVKSFDMSERKIREGIRQLRRVYKVCCIGIPGQGYWIAENREDLNLGLAYFENMIGEFVTSRQALLRDWMNAPSRGGQQLEIIEAPVYGMKGEAEKPFPNELMVVKNNSPIGLTEEQAKQAVYYYWKFGYGSLALVTEKLIENECESCRGDITLAKVWGLWKRLDLPRRKQGGHGLKQDERAYQTCLRKIEIAYKEA